MRNLAIALATIMVIAHPLKTNANQIIYDKIPDAEIVGEGRFSYLFWDLYDASLHAPDGNWNNNKPYALKLRYLRNLDGHKIADRSAEEIRRQGFNDEAKLAAWHSQMKNIFPDVSKGTEIIGIHVPGEETRFYLGTSEIGLIKDPKFGKWFFGIWLSEKTSAPELRTSLLGRK